MKSRRVVLTGVVLACVLFWASVVLTFVGVLQSKGVRVAQFEAASGILFVLSIVIAVASLFLDEW